MVTAIEKEYYIKNTPLKREHMGIYAHMEINESQGHKDPSDHVIIAHALTVHCPLSTNIKRSFFIRGNNSFISCLVILG